MAYRNRKLVKSNIIRVRVTDEVNNAARKCADASGLENSAWYRAVAVWYMEVVVGYRFACERRVHLSIPGQSSKDWPLGELTKEELQAVAKYLDGLGYDVRGGRKRRLADAG